MGTQRSERLGLVGGGEDLVEGFWARHGSEARVPNGRGGSGAFQTGRRVTEVRREGLCVPEEPWGLVWSSVRCVRWNNESLGGKTLI